MHLASNKKYTNWEKKLRQNKKHWYPSQILQLEIRDVLGGTGQKIGRRTWQLASDTESIKRGIKQSKFLLVP